MAKITKKKYKKIMGSIIENYQLIPPKQLKIKRQPLLNSKCHINAYEMSKLNSNYDVVPVVCIDKTMGNVCTVPVFVHFINRKTLDETTTMYIDITLGNMGKELYDYYIIGKPFSPQSALQMIRLLNDTKINLLARFYKTKRKCEKLTNYI